MNNRQEDTLICDAARHFAGCGCRILAAGGNQAALFRFHIEGKRKAPDLVFVLGDCGYVFEAKCTSAALLRKGDREFSDVDSMFHLASDPQAAEEVISEVNAVLRQFQDGGRIERLVVGVLAGTSLEPEILATIPDVVCVLKGEHDRLIVEREPMNHPISVILQSVSLYKTAPVS